MTHSFSRSLFLTGLLSCGIYGSAEAQGVAPIVEQHSTVLEGSHTLCSYSSCLLYTVTVQTTTASGFLELFDLASVPSDGALGSGSTPFKCIFIPASSAVGVSWSSRPYITTTKVFGVFSTAADCVDKTLSATAYFSFQAQ